MVDWVIEMMGAYIEAGKIIYLANDMSTMIFEGHQKGYTPKEVLHYAIDRFKEEMKSDQTLVIPMFSWDFCKGLGYNAKTTKSKVGVLGNILLERADFMRTAHPIYSFFVYGKEAKALAELQNVDAWDEYSPFHYLYEKKAVQVNLDSPLERNFTFVHYVEKKMNSEYRYTKTFSGEYVDWQGRESQRQYTMFVRDLPYRNHLAQLKVQPTLRNHIRIIPKDFFSLEILEVQPICDFIEQDFRETKGKTALEYGRV